MLSARGEIIVKQVYFDQDIINHIHFDTGW